MDIESLKLLFLTFKEKSLFGRYIISTHISPLLDKHKQIAKIAIIGQSVSNEDIYSIKLGSGSKKILMWSQMHGNESTTTKAIFDFLNCCSTPDKLIKSILKNCTICIIPILNPDGAKAYTRVNANNIDLNRDAQNLSQPESVFLRRIFENFQPNYCFNLHGQRTIFSAGKTNKSAVVSFLSPAQNKERSITHNRKIAMEIIGKMNMQLQKITPNMVGIYDDSFNLNCVGDTFQSMHVPTILFEAGHYPEDYNREKTRELIFIQS